MYGLDSSVAQTAQARRMNRGAVFFRRLSETGVSPSSLLLNTQRTWNRRSGHRPGRCVWPRIEGRSASADAAVCSIMERSLHVGAAGVSLGAGRCAASSPRARSMSALAFDEMTQDDQDVESHHVVVSRISPFGIELIVIADIYSCFLCGA
ncbi:hypothetical protein WMF30_45635 [Sorangium sp. So ce134]